MTKDVIWKPVKGYEYKYLISNTGILKSLDHIEANSKYGFAKIKGK